MLCQVSPLLTILAVGSEAQKWKNKWKRRITGTLEATEDPIGKSHDIVYPSWVLEHYQSLGIDTSR